MEYKKHYNKHNNNKHYNGANTRNYNNNMNHNNNTKMMRQQSSLHDTNYEQEEIQEVPTFDDFSQFIKKMELLRGIYSYGFNEPSRIQALTIPLISQKRDLIAQSQSGTGKTGAFTLGTLESINEKLNYPQAIIMAHTRELIMQIESVITELGKYMNIKIVACSGKTSVEQNIKDVKTAHIIISTPGRLKHLMREKAFDINKISLFVLDEADQLLNDDFVEQTKTIIGELAGNCQICIFSATIPRDALMKAEYFMKNPEKLLIKKEKLSLDLIGQFYIDIEHEDNKLELIEDLYCKFSIAHSMIYVGSIQKAEWLANALIERNYTVGLIHSNLDITKRAEVMKAFRAGNTRVLISTDLTARGIDIQQVGIVINYDLPYNPETYLHRIGRSGRFNKKGVAISLIASKKDRFIIKDIENFYRIKIDEMPEIDVINAFLSS